MDWTCTQVYQQASVPMCVGCCCYLSTLTAVVAAILQALQSGNQCMRLHMHSIRLQAYESIRI